MTREEKILLLQLILEDLRGNWSNSFPRARKALEIAKELDMQVFIDSIERYIKLSEDGDNDGRYFRDNYNSGGYEEMHELHQLHKMGVPYWSDNKKEYPLIFIKDRSEDFKREAEEILTYPENRFEDWDEYQQSLKDTK